MNGSWLATVAVFLLALGLLGCSEQNQPASPALAIPSASPPGVAGEAEPFHDRLREVARSYQDYGWVDPEARWAPNDHAVS